MLRHSLTAVIARNEKWSGTSATEPYEVGWAQEVAVFITALKSEGLNKGNAAARVQMSPDGMRWVDEGTTLDVPTVVDGVSMARLRGFGNWLRVVAEIAPSGNASVIVTLHLK